MIRANRPDTLPKIGVSIANDSSESIRANRVANRPCHYKIGAITCVARNLRCASLRFAWQRCGALRCQMMEAFLVPYFVRPNVTAHPREFNVNLFSAINSQLTAANRQLTDN